MGTPLEATRIEEAAENEIAYSLKLTQECVEAIELAMSSKLPITFCKRRHNTLLVIGSGEKAQRFHVRSIPQFQEDCTAVEHDEETARYKVVTDVKAKFQVQATAGALTDIRAKNQKLAEEEERLKTKKPVEGAPTGNRMTFAKGSDEKQAFKAKKPVERQNHSGTSSDEPLRATINNGVSFEPTLTMRALRELAKNSVRRCPNIPPSLWSKYRPKEKSAPTSITPAKLIRNNEVGPGVDEPNRRRRGRSPTSANKRSRPVEEQTRRHDSFRSPVRRGSIHQRSRTRSPLVKRNRMSSPLVSRPSPRRNSLSRSGPRRRFVSPQRNGRSRDRERENRPAEKRDVDMRKPKTESRTDNRKKGCEADLHGYVPTPSRIASLEETKEKHSVDRETLSETVASTKDDRTTPPKSSPAVNWDQLLSNMNDSEVRNLFIGSLLPRLVPGFQFRVQGSEEEWRPTQKNGSVG